MKNNYETEKRYFCDYINEKKSTNWLVVVLLSIIIVFLICFNFLKANNRSKMNSYPEEIYNQLEEEASRVIKEDGKIEFGKDSSIILEIAKDENGNIDITFEKIIPKNTFQSTAILTVKISRNFEKISKKRNCNSIEEYRKNILTGIFLVSTMIALGFTVVETAIFLIITKIATCISKKHKLNDITKPYFS